MPTDTIDARAAQVRAVRFLGVTVLTASLGQALIYLFFVGFDWDPLVANGVAVAIVAVVGFFLSLRFVWTGPAAIARNTQALIFVLMSFVGLVISSVTVRIVTNAWDHDLAANVGSFFGYGVAWALRFFVLDRYVFSGVHA